MVRFNDRNAFQRFKRAVLVAQGGVDHGKAGWVMVIEETGACIVPATIEVVGGQSLGQTRIQADPCSAWDYGGGVMFEDLRSGEEMILRASAPGYSPQDVTVVPRIGPLQAFLILLSRPRER